MNTDGGPSDAAVSRPKTTRVSSQQRGFELWAAVCVGLVSALVLTAGAETAPAAGKKPFRASSVAVGFGYTCALDRSGRAFCWGKASRLEAAGDFVDRRSPVSVRRLPRASSISAGSDHTCAITAGRVQCWGFDVGGGNRGMERVRVPGLVDAVEVEVGGSHTCAVRAIGQTVCWGRNEFGRLGDGTAGVDRRRPFPVVGLSDTKTISAGYGHSCAVRVTGQAVCWGRNDFSQLGNGALTAENGATPLPTPVVGLDNARTIAVGADHTCAIRVSGQAVCWGVNKFGQLGDGTTVNRPVPTAVRGLEDAIAISAGYGYTCAVRASGRVLCWGVGRFGQLGDGTSADRRVPTPVHGLRRARSVSAEHGHACAILRSGHVACWGKNRFGQVGDGTRFNRRVPVQVRSRRR